MLIGGSQADSGRTFTHGFFQEGTRSTQFKASGNYFLRLLPAFDEDKSGTPDYETSHVPYRSKELPEDWKTKTPGFTSWFFVVQGYTWLGKGNQSLVSPLSLQGNNARNKPGVDPIKDVRLFCEKSDDASIRALIEDKSFKERAAAPTTRFFVLCNVLLMTDTNSKKTENQVGIFTNAAWNDLKVKLAYRAGRNDEVISKNWEDFIYGDITDPVEGLAATVRETSAESSENIRFAGAHFSDSPGRLEGHQKWDLSEGNALQNRYRISDESVTRVWSYDEILHYIVQDAVIPYDIVEKACAPYAENGIPKPAGTVSVGSDYNIPSQVNDDEDAVANQNAIGSTPSPVVEKVAEVPTPVVAATATVTPTPTAVVDQETPSVSNGKLTDAEQTRYDELSVKFKTDAGAISHTELPEYFDLCAKLGVSPSK